MNRFPALAISFSLAATMILSACTSNPILNVRHHPITWLDGVTPDEQIVKNAIMLGLVDRGWTGKAVRPGIVNASILVRGRHRAEVDIHYDTSAYSILYNSSYDLDYNSKKGTIHRNYNRWVLNLQSSIDKRLVEAQTSR